MSLRKTLSYLFLPISIWYAVGIGLRNLFYALGLKRQHAPHVTTIGVGNLCTGGSGKTPHVQYLLALLGDTYRTAMLSRGYKRHSKGFVLDNGDHDTDRLGDEAAMIASRFPNVQTAVCEDRLEGIEKLLQQPDDRRPELVVLDDVFQHRRIKPSINILLTEYRHPYFKDHILPFGNLREFKSARCRASAVIVTKSPAVLNPIEKHNIVHDLKLQNYQKIFFSYLKYGPLTTLDGDASELDLRKLDNVLLVTGIAHPAPLLEEVRRCCNAHILAFPDHHEYSRRDIARIKDTFEDLPGTRKVVITTEKDAAKMQPLAESLPCYVMPIEVAFHKDNDVDFDRYIASSVHENISFLGKLKIWN